MLPALLGLALLSLPVSGFMWSGTLNFYANFNDPQAQSGGNQTWKAFGGSASVDGPVNIFEVVFPMPQDGEVEIQPNPGPDDADLVCELTMPVVAQRCDIAFALTAVGDFSDLDVRFADVGDSGILDLHFNDDRHVVVDGQPVALPLLPGEVDLYVKITLETTSVGSQLWSMTVSGPSNSVSVAGSLSVPSLALESIHFLRRAGQVGGIWHLDDVVVTSNDPNSTDFAADGAFRKK